MKYAIETLQIELHKLKEAQRNEDYYSVHPQYRPLEREWKADMISLMKAIELLKAKEGV